MDLDDKQLVKNYLAGDDSAFSELVKKYLKPVYNFLYQLTNGDTTVLDDLTQVTFLKVWKNIKKFDPSRSRFATLRGKSEKNLAPYGIEGSRSGFKIWLFTIAKNTAYDYFKKKKTIPFSNFIDAEGNNKLENISDGEILPSELLAKADDAKVLEDALAKISDQYRLILIMHYKDDLALQEIAEILNLPYNTIKSQHQRGLLVLKKFLVN